MKNVYPINQVNIFWTYKENVIFSWKTAYAVLGIYWMESVISSFRIDGVFMHSIKQAHVDVICICVGDHTTKTFDM